jgi:RNA polymerase sigma-54 factor
MTPQLQQAIKLLQLSNLELSDFVDREIEQNPLLERGEGDGGDDRPSGADNSEAGAEPGGEPEAAARAEIEPRILDSHDLTTSGHMAGGADAPLDADYENVWSSNGIADGGFDGGEAFGDWGSRGGQGSFDDDNFDLEQTLSGSVSLRDHLTQQINVDILDPVDRLIGLALIDLLDETGYLTGDLAGVAAQLAAGQLVAASRLYRQTAAATGDSAVVDLLDDLERLLVDLAASPGELSADELASVRRRIDAEDLLFKIRVLSTAVRERQKTAFEVRESRRSAL